LVSTAYFAFISEKAINNPSVHARRAALPGSVNNSSTVTAEATYPNGFDGELTLEVTVVGDGGEVRSETRTLGPGSEGTISVTQPCSPDETVDITFRAAGRGPGVSVSRDRTHGVSCG
jgi:hypothetical protein